MAISVFIFDDNNSLRHSLVELLSLSGEFIVTGNFSNCLEAENEIKNSAPDVVLMDIDMPGRNGIEAVKQIRLLNKTVPILMLTVFDDNTHILDAICAGASGYLLKKNVSEKLVPAIKDVLNEGASLSPSVAKMIIASMQQNTSSLNYHFTNREKEILSLLCKGNSYKMIASALNLSFETIRTYIKRIYEKLQVHSATEAVSKAINEKLV
ncbi:MAG TPA: response regulator transcription factor [Ferruginibacter sp.]|nr:response regulator transcription factor [Ferruginibacter sp.]HRE63900.1 response regulator transcription factor [Ferruginibacter sp.]